MSKIENEMAKIALLFLPRGLRGTGPGTSAKLIACTDSMRTDSNGMLARTRPNFLLTGRRRHYGGGREQRQTRRHRAGREHHAAAQRNGGKSIVAGQNSSEFIVYANANPGKINMASPGNGTSGHLAGELFKEMSGIDMVHVPYKAVAPALTDLLGGQVQVTFNPMPALIPSSSGLARYARLR